jgi:malate/lactate dehydrogenase
MKDADIVVIPAGIPRSYKQVAYLESNADAEQ